MLFDNNNINLDFTLLDLTNVNENKLNLFTEKEGFLRGNIFKNEYEPYKNLTYINVVPKNDREAKLYNVMCYAHAITDLNLYLDTHPESMEALKVLKEMIKEEEKAKKEYIASYGPLEICDTEGHKFKWINSPWPWENMGGNMYV